MSNYYISRCCGEQVIIRCGVLFCNKCEHSCKVTAVIDTPGGVPEATTANANEISSKLAVDKTEQISKEDPRMKAVRYGTCNLQQISAIDKLLSEQRQSILEEVKHEWIMKICKFQRQLDIESEGGEDNYQQSIGFNQALDTVISIIKCK